MRMDKQYSSLNPRYMILVFTSSDLKLSPLIPHPYFDWYILQLTMTFHISYS